MANHAWVKTRKKMTPESIFALIERLNSTIFKNCIKVEYHKATKEDPGWGPHTWMLTVFYQNKEYFHGQGRVCWLESEHHFEIRHGGGPNFLWWVDTAICNEVALQFNGTWVDDGIGDKEKGLAHKYDRFRKFQKVMHGHAFYWRNKEHPDGREFMPRQENALLWSRMQEDEEFLPEPFCMKNWRYFVKAHYRGGMKKGWAVDISLTPNPKYFPEKKS